MKKEIKFTEEELYWIERTCDIDCSNAMIKFTNLVQTDIKSLTEEEKEMIKKISSELIDLYTFLKGLRAKLELRREDD